MNKFERDQQGIQGVDPSITKVLAQNGFKVLGTLAGVAAGLGLYVAFHIPGNPVFYAGPLIGIGGFYDMYRWLRRAGVVNGATEWELVRKDKEEGVDQD